MFSGGIKMIYVITDNGVIKGNSIDYINKKYKIELSKDELKTFGKDYVIKLTKEDIEFLRDKKKLADIPVRKLFQKDKTGLLVVVVIVLQIIILLSLGG